MGGSTDSSQGGPTVLAVLVDAVARLPQRTLTLACLLLIVLVGVGDYTTGEDLSFSVFYLLPVLIAACSSVQLGYRVGLVSAATWFVADVTGRTAQYDTPLIPLWNASVRFLVFCLVIGLVGALRTSLHHERAQSLSDPLTGLANTRAFFDRAQVELRRLGRTKAPLTVAYLDIDDFKQVNDQFGHAAGDEVLAATADRLAATLRDVDMAARLGGDEFALLLPATDEREANVALDRVHAALSELADERGWPVGFSIGAVTFARPPRSVDDMVNAADRLMYEVKRAGKNGVRVLSAVLAAA